MILDLSMIELMYFNFQKSTTNSFSYVLHYFDRERVTERELHYLRQNGGSNDDDNNNWFHHNNGYGGNYVVRSHDR